MGFGVKPRAPRTCAICAIASPFDGRRDRRTDLRSERLSSRRRAGGPDCARPAAGGRALRTACRATRPRGQLSHRELSRPPRRRPARDLHPARAWRSRRGLPHLRARGGRDRTILRRHRADLEHACRLHAVGGHAGRRPRHGCADACRARPPARAAFPSHRRRRRDLCAAVLRGQRIGRRLDSIRHRGDGRSMAAGG